MLICLDSNVFIAALSSDETHSDTAQQIILALQANQLQVVYSTIVLGEVLGGSTWTADRLYIDDFFASLENTELVPVTAAVARQAGILRLSAGSKLKLPDAIHLATALDQKADVFITNDGRLAKIAQPFVPTKTLAEWSKKAA